jgi:hypothetical protein
MGRAGCKSEETTLEIDGRFSQPIYSIASLRQHLLDLVSHASSTMWIADKEGATDAQGRVSLKLREEHALLMDVGEKIDRLIETRLEGDTVIARRQLGEVAATKARLDEESSRIIAEMASLVSPLLEQKLEEKGFSLEKEQLEQVLNLLTDESLRHSLRKEYVEAWLECESALSDSPFYQELSRRFQEVVRRSERLGQAIRTGEENLHTLRCEIAREELSSQRVFGLAGFASSLGAGRFEKATVEVAASVIPEAWLKDSLNHLSPTGRRLTLIIQPKDEIGKSLFNDEFNIVHVLYPKKHPWVAQVRTAHELMHQIEEARPQLKIAEWAFHQRRTRGNNFDGPQEELQSLRLLDPRGEYYDYEMTRPDHLPHPYLGKQYGEDASSSFELLSFGIEDLLASNLRILRDDADYRRFVYGALALL